MKPPKRYQPMLAAPSTGASGRRPKQLDAYIGRPEWVAQEKVDGLRAILYSNGTGCRLFNRNGVEITTAFPEVASIRMPACVIDGELVARDGSFQTVATRDKQRATRYGSLARETQAHRAFARENPCYFVAFDYLEAAGEQLTMLPLKSRMIALRHVIGRRRNIRPVKQSADILGLWSEVIARGGEGIIVKQLSSKYLEGVRADSWVKFKHTQTITCLTVGYEVGRAREFGAIRLALIGPNGPVPIGKVGTGWNELEGARLKKRLDAGETLLVEVEALNRTMHDELRFPVYRGERTDLPHTAATLEQLRALPTY